ncbi:MAG TPA: glycosyl hydrolase 53 family protein, partial [Chryseolinea sp.]|nr:glycosyl hydrolase 53 family protein [Chryseolinea sp.]
MMIMLLLCMLCYVSCNDDDVEEPPIEDPLEEDFYFGSDLSYVNQILDHGGVYKDVGTVQSPYKIFKDHGANVIRLRLWHNPVWTKQVYGAAGN